MVKYLVIETAYSVICNTTVCNTLGEAEAELDRWIQMMESAITDAMIWKSNDCDYAVVKTQPASKGPWAQIIKIEIPTTQSSTIEPEC